MFGLFKPKSKEDKRKEKEAARYIGYNRTASEIAGQVYGSRYNR